MKIIPVLNEDGVRYIVTKFGFFGRKTMSRDGSWVREGGTASEMLRAAFSPPAKYASVKEAVKDARKNYGEKAKIHFWEG